LNELHPQIRAILAAGEGATEAATVAEAREQYARTALQWVGDGETVQDVRDVTGIGRLYAPEDAHGAVLWIHGGGWIMGTIEAYDALCRALANASGARVLSVDYRLAPESPFPGPVEDCGRALAWLASSYPGEPLAVAGDSAGGNLAAVVARRARDAGGPDLRFQLLVYPVTDAACATASMQRYGAGGYRLTRSSMLSCWDAYAPGSAARSPDASPLRAADLSRLPPALVLLAECDPLTDEGSDYADRLRAAGVAAAVSVYPGMVHGFFRWLGAVDAARDALDEAAAALRDALAD
jgi:acetyl esterase